MTGTVLSNLKRLVKNRPGCRIQGSVIDKTGTGKQIGYRAIIQVNAEERLKFVLTGFSYLPDEPETIGVMKKIPRIGDGESRLILVYFDDRPLKEAMVFHPQAFLDHGEPEAKEEERQARGERWLNLPREYACRLRGYADGEATPRVEPPDPTGQQAADRYFGGDGHV
jgi:hypothetical protein